MKLAAPGSPHLTYCTNIHPGESWAEVLQNLKQYVLAVKAQVCADQPFGVGLRLSARAATELSAPGPLDAFRTFLHENGLYVFTINGFPYGAFHGTRVKEQVYLPDWLDDRRRDYSDLLARLLAEVLPAQLEGSVSTVPGAFKARVATEQDAARIADQLLRHVATLHEIFQRTGKRISLALEPEPCCQLETLAETIGFFRQHLFSDSAVKRLAGLTGLDAAASETFLHHHLGVCFDACHLAVEFEDVRNALDSLRAAGIRVVKFQLSVGLKLSFDADFKEAVAALKPFADEVYLHQVVERRGTSLVRFVDLEQAFATAGVAGPREWRIHFHVPLFTDFYGRRFGNTQDDLRALLKILRTEAHASHLEVETYTWDVLPEEYRREGIVASVARELRWVRGQLEA
jgi:sugar phosphate isomerase/epimerase